MRINKFSQSGSQNTSLSQGLSATLTGPLVLAGNPTGPLEATPKQYVDNSINSLNAANIKTGTINVARLPAFTGDVSSATGSGSFVLNNTGVTAGTYTKVTTDSKGRVLTGANLTNDDIPPFNWSKISTGKPTTVDGYGITDAIKTSGATITGRLTLNLDPTDPMHAANKQYVDSLNSNGANVNTGSIVRRPVSTTPAGFLRANGGSLSRTTYSALFAVIKDPYLVKAKFDYTSYGAMGAGQPWRNQYDINNSTATDLTGWVQGPNLPIGVGMASFAVTKNRVFLLGGSNTEGTALITVYSAPINADGTLGTWVSAGNMPANLKETVVWVTVNRLYVAGGQNETGFPTPVHYAPINADGTLGTWVTHTNSLVYGAPYAAVAVTKKRVYILGGGTTNKTQYAEIDSNGNLGTWTQGPNLPNVITYATALVIRNKVYLFTVGGCYVATIDANGVLGTFATAGISSPHTQSGVSYFATKNRVFCLGGNPSGTGSLSAYSAPIDSNGDIGAWVQISNLPSTNVSSFAGLVVTNGKVHLLGSIANAVSASTYYASLGSNTGLNDYSQFYNGTINKFDGSNISGEFLLADNYDALNGTYRVGNGEPWRQQYHINNQDLIATSNWTMAVSSPVVREQPCILLTKSRVFMIGGYNGTNAHTNTMYYSDIAADGTMSGWLGISNFPVTLYGGKAIVTKNRVYVFGGQQGGGYSTNTYTAVINSSGNLDAWNAGPTVPTTSQRPMVFILKNKVYYFSGYTGSAGSNQVYVATVSDDGVIGAFSAHNTLPVTYQTSCEAIITHSRVYLVSTTGGLEIYVATYNSDGTLGAWSQAPISLGANWHSLQTVVTRKAVYYFSPGTTNSVYVSVINADGTMGAPTLHAFNNVGVTLQNIFTSNNYVYGMRASAPAGDLYRTAFQGGVNDYSSYYSGQYSVISSTEFNLPDLSSLESTSEFYFVKT